jgi:hypothetical protein
MHACATCTSGPSRYGPMVVASGFYASCAYVRKNFIIILVGRKSFFQFSVFDFCIATHAIDAVLGQPHTIVVWNPLLIIACR